jgi:IS30 family transposase
LPPVHFFKERKMARKKKKKKRISIAEQNQIIKMRDSGMSFHAIARKLDRNPSSVLRICNGERGNIRRPYAMEPWRCKGCGGMNHTNTCQVCFARAIRTIKQKKNAPKKKKRTMTCAEAWNKGRKDTYYDYVHIQGKDEE